jgi:predicted aspartyl protease
VKRRTFLSAAAAIGLAMASSTAAQTQKCKLALIAEWALRAEQYRPVIDGAINGQKIGILLDTGAAQSLVRRSGTARLGLTRYPVEGLAVDGAAGAEFVHLDEFRIGRAVRKNWRVSVAGEYDFGDDVFFVLGDDFFNRVDVEFDLAHNVVKLFEAKDCEGASLAYWAKDAVQVPIESGSKIELIVSINGTPLRARLDSSSTRSVVSLPDAERLGVTPKTPGVVGGGCYYGSGKEGVESWIAPFESFAVGNELVRNPRIHIAQVWKNYTVTETGSRLPTSVGGLPAMLLGADFLRSHRVLVAQSQQKIYLSHVGGTVFPSAPSKGCNDASPSDPGPDPLPKQGDR